MFIQLPDNVDEMGSDPIEPRQSQEKKLTTFADIARNSQLEMEARPLFTVPLKPGPSSEWTTKKYVSFYNQKTPETIYEGQEGFLSDIEVDLSKLPEVSILKSNDNLISPDINYGSVAKNNKFSSVRDSIFIRDIMLKGSSEESLQSIDSRVTTGSQMKTDYSGDSVNSQTFPDAEKYVSESDLVRDESTNSRGVQKEWRSDEDIVDKSIQTRPLGRSINATSFGQLYDLENLGRASLLTRNISDIYQKTNKESYSAFTLNSDSTGVKSKRSVSENIEYDRGKMCTKCKIYFKTDNTF